VVEGKKKEEREAGVGIYMHHQILSKALLEHLQFLQLITHSGY
jgi:hypothetical protein